MNTSAAAERVRTQAVTAALDMRQKLRTQAMPTLKYLSRTDVHTFAFSVAANAILSFFPFIVLMLTIVRQVFHSPAMTKVITDLLRDYLPTGQDLVIRRTTQASSHHHVELVSLLMLLVTSTGVFLPLEVALNQIWGFTKNRNYLMNQLISLGLVFSCGVLAMTSVALTAGNQVLMGRLFGGGNIVTDVIEFLVMKIFAICCSVSIFFLIYWILPHGKVPAKAVLPVAFVGGVFLEVAKLLYVLSLPWLNFQEVYGPFSISVTLIFWAFLSGLLLLALANLSAAGVEKSGSSQNG